MDHINQTTTADNTEPPAFWSSRYAIGLIVIGSIATYFLLSEHRAHFLGALPLLLLLSCPLMHVFMHHGHAGHGGHQGHQHRHGGDSASTPATKPPTPQTGEQP